MEAKRLVGGFCDKSFPRAQQDPERRTLPDKDIRNAISVEITGSAERTVECSLMKHEKHTRCYIVFVNSEVCQCCLIQNQQFHLTVSVEVNDIGIAS